MHRHSNGMDGWVRAYVHSAAGGPVLETSCSTRTTRREELEGGKEEDTGKLNRAQARVSEWQTKSRGNAVISVRLPPKGGAAK